jgi:uncharacterized DUF497 family protein
MRFEWDNDKAGKNISKHGISFEEASGVFDDPLFLKFADPDHSSAEEKRCLIIGESERGICCWYPIQSGVGQSVS